MCIGNCSIRYKEISALHRKMDREENSLYYNLKNKASELLNTMLEVVNYIYRNPGEIDSMLPNCLAAIEVVEQLITSDDLNFGVNEKIVFLKNQFKSQDSINQIWYAETRHQIRELFDFIWNKIPTRWRMYFLPYKASMWTCMESMWRAAEDDPNCDAKVIVIPYDTLWSNGKVKEHHYEVMQFPKNVPVFTYHEVHFEDIQPEFIVIHNPYDDTNNLTRVPSQFFSYNLVKYTNCLAYSPYHTFFANIADKVSSDRLIYTSASRHCDKILVQSKNVKKQFVNRGFEPKKILSLGSPKFDAIINLKDKNVQIPEEWTRKLKGRKVLLYTFSLLCACREKWIATIYDRMKNHWNDPDVGFIFRPHPLLVDYCTGRQINVDIVKKIFELSRTDDRIVLDLNDSYLPAFQFSDGLFLSESSSLINEYLVTGKPIYWDRMNYDIAKSSNFNKDSMYADMTVLYCPRKIDGMDGESCHQKAVDEYFKIVKGEAEDVKQKARIRCVKKYFKNADGSAGKKIYRALVDEYICLPRKASV